MTLLVSVQQAACNALAAFLKASLANNPSVEARWPDPSKRFGAGTDPERPTSVTIILRGAPHDEYLDGDVTQSTDNGDGTLTVRRASVFRVQPIQMDIWTAIDLDRDDLIAQLDQLIGGVGGNTNDPIVLARRMPDERGLALTLGDGWGSPPLDPCVADFSFSGPANDDTADDVGRVTYRAMYKGEARMLVSVTSTDPKLARLTLKQSLQISGQLPAAPALQAPPAAPVHLEIDTKQDTTGNLTFTDGG